MTIQDRANKLIRQYQAGMLTEIELADELGMLHFHYCNGCMVCLSDDSKPFDMPFVSDYIDD